MRDVLLTLDPVEVGLLVVFVVLAVAACGCGLWAYIADPVRRR